ncbi:MAG: HutD family protein [Myxococcota bacterium]|nr:HutD family protein [Myxococcota bacterium]
MRTITPSQWRPQAWKNGRGTTSEVLRLPDLDDYDLRISVAEVSESGPFSTFPGYTRWSLLLDGGPIWLGERRLTALSQLDGALQIEARVDAPGRLLNILGRGIAVGVGEEEADIVFDLSTYETRVFDQPTRASGVWIRR